MPRADWCCRQVYRRISPSEDYYKRTMLGLEDDTSWSNMGGLKWDLVGCLAAAWLIVCLCLIKGVQSSGKVVYVSDRHPSVAKKLSNFIFPVHRHLPLRSPDCPAGPQRHTGGRRGRHQVPLHPQVGEAAGPPGLERCSVTNVLQPWRILGWSHYVRIL